jgi:hypothetical protein
LHQHRSEVAPANSVPLALATKCKWQSVLLAPIWTSGTIQIQGFWTLAIQNPRDRNGDEKVNTDLKCSVTASCRANRDQPNACSRHF